MSLLDKFCDALLFAQSQHTPEQSGVLHHFHKLTQSSIVTLSLCGLAFQEAQQPHYRILFLILSLQLISQGCKLLKLIPLRKGMLSPQWTLFSLAYFINSQKANQLDLACGIKFPWELIYPALSSNTLFQVCSLLTRAAYSFLCVPFPEHLAIITIDSGNGAFSMASHKLTSGPHQVSLGFLRNLPPQLATFNHHMAFTAYLISLNG